MGEQLECMGEVGYQHRSWLKHSCWRMVLCAKSGFIRVGGGNVLGREQPVSTLCWSQLFQRMVL